MTATAQSAAQPEVLNEPEAGTPEYDAAMAARGATVSIQSIAQDGRSVSQVNTPAEPESNPASADSPPADPNRPAWLPEKFKSAEDMAKAYSELEQKLSGTSKPTEALATEAPSTDTPPSVSGLDTNKFFTEFAANGALAETSYAELAKAGLSKDVVDAYIAGQAALQETRTRAGYEAVGGEDNYKQMVAWAQANMTPAEIHAFNTQVGSTTEAAMLAVQGMKARYTAAVGSAPTGLLNGGAQSAVQTSGYQSRAQVVQAMSDPRYESDPAYRNSVMQKLGHTADSVL